MICFFGRFGDKEEPDCAKRPAVARVDGASAAAKAAPREEFGSWRISQFVEKIAPSTLGIEHPGYSQWGERTGRPLEIRSPSRHLPSRIEMRAGVLANLPNRARWSS